MSPSTHPIVFAPTGCIWKPYRINFTASLPMHMSCPPSERVSISFFISRCTWSTASPARSFIPAQSHFQWQHPSCASVLSSASVCSTIGASSLSVNVCSVHRASVMSGVRDFSIIRALGLSGISAAPLSQCCPFLLRSSCFGDVLRQCLLHYTRLTAVWRQRQLHYSYLSAVRRQCLLRFSCFGTCPLRSSYFGDTQRRPALVSAPFFVPQCCPASVSAPFFLLWRCLVLSGVVCSVPRASVMSGVSVCSVLRACLLRPLYFGDAQRGPALVSAPFFVLR
jgi:hypothetical protein